MRRIRLNRISANVDNNNYLYVVSNTILGANLVTSNVTEGSNLYFTNARSYANTLVALKSGNGIAYDSATGNITLAASGVQAGNYGNSTHYVGLVIDSFGRITSANTIFSSGSSEISQNYIYKTANYTANVGDNILANSAGGSFTITLPPSPSTGNTISIADAGYWDVYTVTVSRNGNTIESLNEDLLLDAKGVMATLIYNGGTWHVITSLGKQGVQGNQGIPGTVGVQGATGAGSQGNQGVQGSAGAQGNAGAQGTIGSQGVQGATGPLDLFVLKSNFYGLNVLLGR